ncbi:homeobox protein Nkx-2.2-like [Sycon ciliatum]|uniref:homeobox protein Nkx-2.2-like n=1 Tax=Sycon ciliatum TaxID=27933 RepID=UPI0031F6611E
MEKDTSFQLSNSRNVNNAGRIAQPPSTMSMPPVRNWAALSQDTTMAIADNKGTVILTPHSFVLPPQQPTPSSGNAETPVNADVRGDELNRHQSAASAPVTATATPRATPVTPGNDVRVGVGKSQSAASTSTKDGPNRDTGNVEWRNPYLLPKSTVMKLECIFRTKIYISKVERQELANRLNLTMSQVRMWFARRRKKLRSSFMESTTNGEDISHTTGMGGPAGMNPMFGGYHGHLQAAQPALAQRQAGISMAAAIPQMPMPAQQQMQFHASAMSGSHGAPPSAMAAAIPQMPMPG